MSEHIEAMAQYINEVVALAVKAEQERIILSVDAAVAEARREERERCSQIVRSLMVYGDARDQRLTYDKGWSDALLKADDAISSPASAPSQYGKKCAHDGYVVNGCADCATRTASAPEGTGGENG